MPLGNLWRGDGNEPQLKSHDCLQVVFRDTHCGAIKDNKNLSSGFFGRSVFIKYYFDLGSEVNFCLGFTVRRFQKDVNLEGSAAIAF